MQGFMSLWNQEGQKNSTGSYGNFPAESMSQKYLDKSFLGKKTRLVKDKKIIHPKRESGKSFNKNK